MGAHAHTTFAFIFEDDGWKGGKLEALRKLFFDGLSHAEIAAELKVGKGAVSAKIARLGWFRPGTVVDRRRREHWVDRVRYRAPDYMGQMISMDAFTRTSCKYPVTHNGEEHLFCGDERQAGSQYCEHHHAKCYRRVTL